MAPMRRSEVYALIDGERLYQESLWMGNRHSLDEWVLYIEDYISEAKHALSRLKRPECDVKASDIMRKVAAMAVCALEQHGGRSRVQEGEHYESHNA